MLTLYAKLVDRLAPPALERMFRLGRRATEERRLRNEDRRRHADDALIHGHGERRTSERARRKTDLNERRQRWFRINTWQSRHFNWSPENDRNFVE